LDIIDNSARLSSGKSTHSAHVERSFKQRKSAHSAHVERLAANKISVVIFIFICLFLILSSGVSDVIGVAGTSFSASGAGVAFFLEQLKFLTHRIAFCSAFSGGSEGSTRAIASSIILWDRTSSSDNMLKMERLSLPFFYRFTLSLV